MQKLEAQAVSLRDQRRYDQAEALYKRAFIVWQKLLGSKPRAVKVPYFKEPTYQLPPPALEPSLSDPLADNLEGLALVYCDAGRYKDAAQAYARSLSMKEKSLGPTDPSVGITMRGYAEVLRKTNRLKEAELMESRADKIVPPMCGTPALHGANPPPAPEITASPK